MTPPPVLVYMLTVPSASATIEATAPSIPISIMATPAPPHESPAGVWSDPRSTVSAIDRRSVKIGLDGR
jgi:hypothetical protein